MLNYAIITIARLSLYDSVECSRKTKISTNKYIWFISGFESKRSFQKIYIPALQQYMLIYQHQFAPIVYV